MGNQFCRAVRRSALALMLVGMGLAGNASATLFDRGGGLIYDNALNITWLQDANYAKTSGFDADGRMTWSGANSWAAGLNYYDSVRNVTYSDWRLAGVSPTSPTTSINNCNSGGAAACAASGNELAYMYFFNLGGGFADYTGNQTSVLGGVTLNNIQYIEWSATEYGAGYAWALGFGNGGQGTHYITFANGEYHTEYAGWAVRDGDVAVTPIPEPEIYAMLGLGLGLMGWVGRRKKLQAAA